MVYTFDCAKESNRIDQIAVSSDDQEILDMASKNEINEKINIFNKKIKKKIYKISALKHKGIVDIKKALVRYVL